MLKGGKNIWLSLGESDIMGVRENEEKEKQRRRGRTSQTREAIKKCETSAVRSARQGTVVRKHNGGRGAEEEERGGARKSEPEQAASDEQGLIVAEDFWAR